MKQISMDNGCSFIEPAEAIESASWDVIVHYMDDDTRELVHRDIAPCSELEFLIAYLEKAEYDLIIG